MIPAGYISPKRTKGTILTGTAPTAVLAPNEREFVTVEMVNIVNPTIGPVNVGVYLYDGTGTITLHPLTSLAAGARLHLIDIPLALRHGHELRVSGDAGIHVLATASITALGNVR
jgi:hypothetical protein